MAATCEHVKAAEPCLHHTWAEVRAEAQSSILAVRYSLGRENLSLVYKTS